MKQTRRSFLQTSLFAATAATFSARSWAQVEGANSDIRIGAIGFRGRGMENLGNMLKSQGVRMTGLCDVDESVLAKGKDYFGKQGHTVETYRDMRKMLESKDVDAVMVATPNHWHALAAIWAVQAGKDVYVEKPVSHNVFEGRKLVEAAQKYGRIVQAGTQSRSSAGLHQAAQYASEGNLGKLQWARGTCYKRRISIGKVDGEQPIPAGIDYDLWCGPAPMKPLMRAQLHYDWHWVWDTGNGDLGNQGIHQVDIARWFLGEPKLSPSVMSIGGRLGYVDDGETPNTQILVYGYEKAPLYFEVRGLPSAAESKEMDKYRGAAIGVVVQYENGYLAIPSYTAVAAFSNDGEMIKRWGTYPKPKEGVDPGDSGSGKMEDHQTNFIQGVRTRNSAKLAGSIEGGHISSALCHLGNISHRLGKTRDAGEIREQVKADANVSEALGRALEHLEANNVDVKKDQLTYGVPLKFNPDTERFIDNAEADRQLTREYRAPYIVPEKV